jgi:hypothetical protein
MVSKKSFKAILEASQAKIARGGRSGGIRGSQDNPNILVDLAIDVRPSL